MRSQGYQIRSENPQYDLARFLAQLAGSGLQLSVVNVGGTALRFVG
jgi:hypothetical protein